MKKITYLYIIGTYLLQRIHLQMQLECWVSHFESISLI